MADQSVRIENLDNTKERVAFDLMRLCADRESWKGIESRAAVLALYAQCLSTVRTASYKGDAT